MQIQVCTSLWALALLCSKSTAVHIEVGVQYPQHSKGGVRTTRGSGHIFTPDYANDADKDQHSMLLTHNAKLLRSEKHKLNCPEDINGDCIKGSSDAVDHAALVADVQPADVGTDGVEPADVQTANVPAVAPVVGGGGYEDRWQQISIGDVQAIAVHKGHMYAVGKDPLAVLECGIFTQPLYSLTPFSNWTLIGYGQLSSIAIHDSPTGSIMYGVGNSSWLYKQDLAAMAEASIWQVASVFKLSAIGIDGDYIYGISPDHPGLLYTTDLRWMAEFSGWRVVNNGNIRSFSVSNGMVFAIAENNGIYNKMLAGTSDKDWDLTDQTNVLDISVVGDTMWAVKSDHKIYRQPVKINTQWSPFCHLRVRSVAIGPYEDTMYAIKDADGRVYKKSLSGKTMDDHWLSSMLVSDFQYSSLAIQGSTIYAVGQDKKVYKQDVHKMSGVTQWHPASACCVKQIAAADGIIYAIGAEDGHIYSQADLLMTNQTDWIVTNVVAKFLSIAIRGDTIFGISTDQLMLEQRVGWLTKFSEWSVSSFEDSEYPSNKYLSISAHNDIMYAVGLDHQVYSKFISKPVAYPPHLTAKGNTRWQALHWNLTDLEGELGKRLVKTEAGTQPQANATDNGTANATDNSTPANAPASGEHMDSTPSTTQPLVMESDVYPHFVDRYQDLAAPKKEETKNTSSVGFKSLEKQVESSAWRDASVCFAMQMLLLRFTLGLTL